MDFSQIKLDEILQIITIIGIIFAIYLYFRKPQEKSEMKDLEIDLKFNNLEKTVINLRDNHLHTIESKLDKHINENQMVAIETTRSLTRVETLMEQLLKK